MSNGIGSTVKASQRSVLIIGAQELDEQIRQTLVAAGWSFDLAPDLHSAQTLIAQHPYRVGLILFEHPEQANWPGLRQFLSTNSPMAWVALIAPGILERRLSELIYEHCFDYLSLPLERERLLFTLGHAYGMAVLCEPESAAASDKPMRTGMAVQEHEPWLHNLIEGPIQGVLIHVDWQPVFINQRYAELLGYDSTDELLAKGIDAWTAPHERARLHGYQQARLHEEQEAPAQYEYQALRKDGSLITLENVVKLIDWQGRKATQSVVVDVSGRKRAERALHDSEQRFQAIFNQTFQFIGLLTPDGTLLEANRTALDFAGLEWTQVIGRPFWEAPWWSLSTDTQERLKAAIAEAARGVFVRYEVDVCGAGEQVITIDFSLKPICDPAGQVVLLIPEGRDISEIKQTRLALEQSHQELRQLASHLQSVREEECARIAREVHDEMGQSLTALKLDLARLHGTLQRRAEPLAGEIGAMVGNVDDMIGSVQRVCSDLRPAALDDLGLVAACEWQLEQFQRHTGIVCDAMLDPDQALMLDDGHKTALFRIVQEALTNIARHAQATRVQVRLAREGDALVLEVVDNGIGMSALACDSARAFGILGMRERAHMLGGKLSVSATPGDGARVRCVLPLTASAADAATAR